ncbi:isoprenylcysteine carboxylmethyltransferase family protein [Ectothiorhodospira sp. BSL-9]|uniref:methyltransferase family protein n=1 Tax=Ectothiorhodospira sp. BSL-9 TaxID=1442136 RepID=UPI0007B44BBD|nr:hypothetical protein ECTOBSL9_1331 [Ectothiorhodospira sp. BSL-9]
MTLKDSAAWWTKVAASGVLIGLVIERFVAGGLPGWPSPAIPLAQLLVVVGGCITLAHYTVLRRKGVTCTEPQELVRSGGLFPSTRHPMYLGDAVTCVGLAMLAPSVAAGLILVVAIAALVIQARLEDKFLARRFPIEHGQWRARSGLLLPRLSPSRGVG